jgi:hypothetical protein
METAYSWTVTEDNEIIFTKDEERISFAHDYLVHTIQCSNLIPDPMDDMLADHYATYLENKCIKEYAAAFKIKTEVAADGQV